MLHGVKIEVYPTTTQIEYLSKLFGCARKVYNIALDYKSLAYEKEKRNVNKKEIQKLLYKDWLKSKEYFYLKEHNTKVLKESLRNLDKAFNNFFKRPEVGYPQFKSKYDNKQTAHFPDDAISTKNDYSSGRLTLTKQLKDLKFNTSVEYTKYLCDNKEFIRSATITKT
jgi:putative transposase